MAGAEKHFTVALAGNPNVGKSSIFNALTGMRQHTGNWPGKTVSNARGTCSTACGLYTLVDLPGTYSLLAHSLEEEIARDFLCEGRPDVAVVVCDATCLERSLNLALQTIELLPKVIVCINLMDEAEKKGIHIDLDRLSELLGVPVAGVCAHQKSSLKALLRLLDLVAGSPAKSPVDIVYPAAVEQAAAHLALSIPEPSGGFPTRRCLALRQLGQSDPLMEEQIVSALIQTAEDIFRKTVTVTEGRKKCLGQKLDRLLTGRLSGYPAMVILLALILWLTMAGANYPSRFLSEALFWVQDRLSMLFMAFHAPIWLHDLLVLGVYRTVAWVVSVMLPPMAIFFPLFTLLEDAGFLPRIAYNLDRPFQCCHACGKQALTMCMGFGCNAVGVTGCRIIDSPRERLLAILTNSFVPCNGRFPTLISLITMFLIGTTGGAMASVLPALLLTALIVLGIGVTFLSTGLLSVTLLKGMPSAFTLELPPYRKPQFGTVIVRSVFDRTLFVLGRAVAVAAPAGLLLWLTANLFVEDVSILNHCAAFLDPFAELMGLDGVILLAFVLGFPANEIVMPVILMAYLSQGSLLELSDLGEMKALLIAHGWTWTTAVSTLLFSLMHWPCSTTLLTIYKETKSLKWMGLAALLPTAAGVLSCMLFTWAARCLQ